MKILIADNVSERAIEVLTAEKSWDVVFLPKQPNASLTEEIKDADALVVRSATKATAALLEGATRLRAIGRAGSGVDNVDLDAATKKGIVVMNTPGGNAVSVARDAPPSATCPAAIWAVAKLKDTLTGDTLADKGLNITYPPVKLPEPSIAFAIEAKSRNDEDRMGNAVHRILEEDQSLRFTATRRPASSCWPAPASSTSKSWSAG